ncbi:MAG: hypothetical protein U5J64_00405 [Halobacteriales archaeon]|nr:hypothetical protein [Halobacteriales archaeon]
MTEIGIGSTMYDEDGDPVGEVRGFDPHGVVVSTDEDVSIGGVVSADPSVVGESDLLWRCSGCGEIGEVEDMPDGCPSCGAPKTDLYYWSEAYD